MLRSIQLSGVGPAARFRMELGDRLNIFTGDNGLGKSFLLDVAWWTLAGTWVDLPASPREDSTDPKIGWVIQGKRDKSVVKTSKFSFPKQKWERPHGRPTMPGLVLYARVDGSFAVWDPARNYWKHFKDREIDDPDRPDAYSFSKKELWEGLRPACEGMVRDWVRWQEGNHPQFRILKAVLEKLSPPDESIALGSRTMRIAFGESLEYPTLIVHGDAIAIAHASAAVKRILGLAYLIVWSWVEHVQASKLLRQPPTGRMVLLMDEVETHLHPKWQRTLLPALLEALRELSEETQIQALVTTHSPLVLASLEPYFDLTQDKLFLFERKEGAVVLEESPWTKYGDAVGWLTSDIFHLKEARSVEAERAIRAAYAFMRGDHAALPQDLRTQQAIHQALERLLPAEDPFWVQWIVDQRRRHR